VISIRTLMAAALTALCLWAAVAMAASAPVPGSVAPDFALPAVRGGNVRLSEYRGSVVVLSFWSSQCGQCAAQLEALADQQRTYAGAGLVTIAVSVDSDLRKARDYALAHAGAVPLLLDAKRDVGRNYAVARLPTTVLIDRRGRIQRVYSDYRRIDNSYISQLRALLDDVNSTAAPIY
jgi:peroxiredoxin